MKRIRETLARLTNSNRASRGEDDLLLGTSGRTSTKGPSRETLASDHDGRGPVVLFDGTESGEQGIDIVFVHGLFGHRIFSWTHNGTCWPRDLLKKDLQDSRIISWGWTGPFGDTNTFADQAESLLRDVSEMRSETSRSIVFVGHGLGGLVIKEALNTAAYSRIYGSHHELGNVYPRTVGVVFLGTPHTSRGNQSLGEVVAAAARISPRHPSPELLEVLQDGTEAFENQRDTFAMISRDIGVLCVGEKLPTPTGQMIPKASTAYEGFSVESVEIKTSHFGLARYTSRNEVGYQRVAKGILKLSHGPAPQINKRESTVIRDLGMKEVRNAEILRALYFDTMYERKGRIDEAYGQTCSWILESGPDDESDSPFYSWLQSNEPIFWVNGKAGSGKSTLMKYASHDEKTRERLLEWARGGELLYCSVFLFEGGSQVQKSREGILRNCLYQILTARRDLISVAFPSFFNCDWPPPIPFNSVINLNQAFYSLFAHTSESLYLCMWVDGLDEYRIMDRKDHYAEDDFALVYDGDDEEAASGSSKWINESHMDIARLINEMGSKDTIKLCVSSRQSPVFEEAFQDRPRLSVHENSQKAVAHYCAGRLEEALPGLSDMPSLCREVARRSRGDVLWARLAIDMLVDGSLRTLRARFDSLPSRLGGTDGLYMRMIEELEPGYQRDACKIFQLVLGATQPPLLLTLAFAAEGYLAEAEAQQENPTLGNLRIAHDQSHPLTAEHLQSTCDQMQHRLVASCAGLLVVESGPLETGQHVVFMHQTAKEFAGRKDVWNQLLGPQPTSVELDLCLLSGCIRHIRYVEALRPPISAWPDVRFIPEVWLLIANALRYAARIDDYGEDREAYYGLLDVLDETNKQAWITSLGRHVPLLNEEDWYETKRPTLYRKHWAGYEPMETGRPPKRKDFLALAVQASLVNYVSAKLAALPREERRGKAQELLVHVISPKAEGFSACVSLSGDYVDFHHDMPDSRLLDVLFENGADPRESSKLWLRVFQAGRQYFSRQNMTMSQMMQSAASSRLTRNRQRWVTVVKALLIHGADPHATIEMPSAAREDQSKETKTAAEFIRETLEGEPEYAVELVELDTLTGRRPSLTVGIAR